MAFPTVVPGSKVGIYIGDGATPEVFTKFCGFTTRTFTRSGQTNDTYLQDCADDTAVPVRRVNVTGESFEMTGEGFYNKAQRTIVNGAFFKSKNYQFKIDDAIWSGPAKLTNEVITGADGEDTTSNMTFLSDGAWVLA